ncbi:hypothetical protein [Lactococcus ileimucosae]|uniref:hypothetical protein n=1 Tax=Lactococcus ileimucosae TaxID=2941329 RepID=UPI002042F87C|nr:hypothetical protein [Lactococcus ileimucosae]
MARFELFFSIFVNAKYREKEFFYVSKAENYAGKVTGNQVQTKENGCTNRQTDSEQGLEKSNQTAWLSYPLFDWILNKEETMQQQPKQIQTDRVTKSLKMNKLTQKPYLFTNHGRGGF